MPLDTREPTSSSTALLPVEAPYRLDLTATVLRRTSANAVDAFDAGGAYRRALATGSGTVAVTVRQVAPDALEVVVVGRPGARAEALRAVERMLATGTGPGAFASRARRIPWLAPLACRMRGVRPPRYPTLWEACANAIVFQQVSLHAAGAIMRRFVRAYGERVETDGGELYAFPAPGAALAASDADLRAAGLSVAKVAALRNVVRALSDGTLDESVVERSPSSEAAEYLCRVKGIGPWSAALILLRGMGRLDVFPAGDSGVARGLSLFGPGAAATPAVLDALGNERGMLYFHVLLARLEARGELP
jgi:DNA-3-methyladenine glycosylase II